LFSLDGKENRSGQGSAYWRMEKLGFFSAQEVLNNGGTKLMMEIKTIWRNNESNKYFIN
jgi:hydroxymethylbilane synthase